MKKVLSAIVILIMVVVSSFQTEAFAAEQSTTVNWSKEKTAVYTPLLNSTLLWYDEVMKPGGFDVETEMILTDRTKADFIMNQYSHIGARKIATSTSFGKPIDRKSIVFEKDGLGYLLTSKTMEQGKIFLIEASDGKLVQIRIDRIVLPSEVQFTYVVEQEQPVVEDPDVEEPTTENPADFTKIPRKFTNDPLKMWTVSFNDSVDGKTLDKKIYVRDSKGTLVAVNVKLSTDGKKVYVTPLMPYKGGETYTIYVLKDIKNTKGFALKKGTMMPFVIDESVVDPDKTAPAQLIGLAIREVGSEIHLEWVASSAADLAGYRVYYRVEGEPGFQKLLKNGRDELFYSAAVSLTFFKDLRGKTVEFYATAVDKSGNESIRSQILRVPFNGTDGDPNKIFDKYFGTWVLESSLASFGELTIYKDGNYNWTGYANNISMGKWEVRSYGLVLLNANSGYDYLIAPSDRNQNHIKLQYIEYNTHTDGSPSFNYFSEGKR